MWWGYFQPSAIMDDSFCTSWSVPDQVCQAEKLSRKLCSDSGYAFSAAAEIVNILGVVSCEVYVFPFAADMTWVFSSSHA